MFFFFITFASTSIFVSRGLKFVRLFGYRLIYIWNTEQGRSQDFSKGGGGHTVSNIIVMAFSPRNIVGFVLKKG